MKRVLVAGAGPVGLTVALALARAGVPVTVFEKRSSRNTASKASTFHPPTLAILDALGVAGEALRLGVTVPAIAWLGAQGLVARLDMALLAGITAFPFRLHFEQSELTRVMLDALARHPDARVEYDAEITGVHDEGSVVTVTLADGRIERGMVLVGADGAKSTVREALGIAFEGADYATRGLRVMSDEDMPRLVPGLEPISYVHLADDSMSCLRMPECWRLIFRPPAELADDAVLAPGYLQSRIRRFVALGGRPLSIVAADVYATGHRVAAGYARGRVAIAGDACHVTNTRGGMNMNCGIHDAWVLAQAVRRIADGADAAATLAGYGTERRTVAVEQVIPRTDRNVRRIGPALLDEMRTLADDPAAARAYLVRASMIDIAPHDIAPAEDTHAP